MALARSERDDSAGFSSSRELVALPLPRRSKTKLLLKLLARGGMGDVYLAASTGIEGAELPCVVKTIRRDHAHDGSFLARFLDEARVQAQLNHPGVARVLEAATDDDGQPFTVVEYVEGRNLAEVRHRATELGVAIAWADAVAIAIEIAQALAHVHERVSSDGAPLGIVHRDLSPQNVMVGYGGEVKLIDFGTARGQNRRSHTVAGVVFAKPGYVAPEIARQEVGDGRIDIYALGVLLWELCAGRRLPFGEPQKHLERVANGEFTLPTLGTTRDVPRGVDDVIARLTANEPDDRYRNAHDAVRDLVSLLRGAEQQKSGSRSVRARVAELMETLWPDEPHRSRSEFAELVRQGRGTLELAHTPEAGPVNERHRQSTADANMLLGTPYRLLREIGEGSSGKVYEAEHVELGRRVAVKVLSSTCSIATDAVERMRREAKTMANLSHPNLAFLHDFGTALDGHVYLVMELLSGKTLDDRTPRIMPWRRAAELVIAAAAGLTCAHDAGLVHRDIKPQNLFLTDAGVLKVLDFGLAMAISHSREEERPAGFCIFGTPEYMAPEQVRGEPVDARSDVYALGCVLYELVTGTPPFEGASSVIVMGRQLNERPESPRKREPRLPIALESVIMRAIEKLPANRYTSTRELAGALRSATRGQMLRDGARKAVAGLVVVGALGLVMTAGYKQWRTDHAVGVATLETASQDVATARMNPAVIDVPAAPVTEFAAPESGSGAVSAPRNAHALPEMHPADPRAAESPAGDMSPVRRATMREPAPTPTPANLAAPPAALPGELEAARERARQNPGDRDALRGWAETALRAHAYEEAERASVAWSARDRSIDAFTLRAQALEGRGKHGEARMVMEQCVRAHPESVEAKKYLQRLGGKPKRGRHPAQQP